jgi:transporter family-2 protein
VPVRVEVLAGLATLFIGVVGAVQGRINGELALRTQDPLLAAALSMVVGLVLLAVIVAFRPHTRRALVRVLPAKVRARELRWFQLVGGLGGAFFVTSQGLAVPGLGVALFTVLVVAGTTGSSLVMDAWGVGPGGRVPVTLPRVLAAVGTTLAVLLAVSGRISAGTLVVSLLIVSLAAGALSTYQQAVNGQVAMRTGDPLVATVLNFCLALVALSVAVLVEHLVLGRAWTAPPLPWHEPLLWTGGFIGVMFVLVSAIVVRPLGVLLYSLLSVGGQLVGALLTDLLVPSAGVVLGWQVVAGVVLTGLSVTIAAVRR